MNRLALKVLSVAAALTAIIYIAGLNRVSAQNPSSAASKYWGIGIVNIQDAIIATNDGKKEFDALQQRFAPRQNELKARNDEVENLKKTLQAQAEKLSEAERNTRLKELETKQKALQRDFDDAQNEFQQAEQEVVNRIGKKMLDVLDKYAKENGYAVIVDVSNPKTPVLWASRGAYITKDLVDAYNAAPPAAGAVK